MSASTELGRMDASVDVNQEPRRDVQMWSETRWNGCWNPELGVGLYIHVGRYRRDLDLWWAQTVAYLPDGKLAVDRSFGRSDDSRRVQTGSLDLRAERGGWSSSFDGVAELTSTAALTQAPRGASAPSVPMRWEVRAAAASPVWDIYGDMSEKQIFAGDTHIEQSFTTTGTLTVDGQDYRLDGIGFKDHSSGVRDWNESYGSHAFVVAVMPGWSMHSMVLRSREGAERPPMGALFSGGEQHPIMRSELSPNGDLLSGPADAVLTVQRQSGEPFDLRLELLHQLPIMITDAGDNINGIGWGVESPSMVVMEGIAKVKAPDGTVGHAFFERGSRRESLARPGGEG
jgi:hypothetical protein